MGIIMKQRDGKNVVYIINRMFILFIILTVFACKTQSQINAPIETIEGKNYYMHSVEKGQTLYAISKIYACDINTILSANPGADNGIKEGQTLKIPTTKPATSSQPSGETKTSEEFIIHIVEKRETLFSIARKYNVDVNKIIAANPGTEEKLNKGQQLRIPTGMKKLVESTQKQVQHTVRKGETLFAIARQYSVPIEAIQNANPGISENLKEGQVLNIPSRALPNDHSDLPKIPTEESKPKVENQVAIIGGGKKSEYTISLMLPFYLESIDSTLSDREKLFRDAAVQFYRGVQMAADSLATKGFNGKFIINDVVDTKTSIRQAIEKKENEKADLIVGPAFKDGIAEVSALSNKTGAHVVLPFPLTNKALLNSQNISKACPSDATIWEYMGHYAAEHHAKDNVILILSNDIEDTRQIQVFSQAYFNTKKDSVIALKNASSLGSKLSSTKNNVVFVPTNDKKIITTVFEQLRNAKAIVYGTDEWENSASISADNRNTFNVRFPKTLHLNYNEESDQHWIEQFRKAFRTEPSTFAVMGYDLMLYYGQGLLEYGRDFPNHFREIKVDHLIGTNFNYFKTGAESGFENQHCFILETVDYEIKELKQ